MTERPILFQGAMVRAILDGSKAQTRRIVKPAPPSNTVAVGRWQDPGPEPAFWAFLRDGPPEPDHPFGGAELLGEPWRCPYGQPGDRLWVRETWYCDDYRVQRGPYLKPDDMDVAEAQGDGTLVYRASSGDRPYEAEQPVWRPAIHMPRWASRITLEITGVRVERLQDISEGDAQAEGAMPIPDPCDHVRLACADIGCSGPQPHRVGFRSLWESINGDGSWAANPWVWVVEFKRLP